LRIGGKISESAVRKATGAGSMLALREERRLPPGRTP
jgi:hypothetical protein